MKKIAALFLFYSSTFFSQGVWTQMSNFPRAARTGAVAFEIKVNLYMATGMDGLGNMLNDFWEYDPTSDTWVAKANFGGAARWNAVGFSIGTKGYIGTGSGFADFWEYNPATNVWTVRAAYGGGAMSASSGWGVSSTGKGYLGGCGLDNLSNFTRKFYEYDQAANTWTARTQPPFSVSTNPLMRYWGVGFAIGTKGYLLSGMSTMAGNVKDLYEYDPATNTWASRATYTAGFGVWNATGYGLSGKGYMVTGEDDAGNTPAFHREYNPASNSWALMAPFPGTGRQVCTSFTVNSCFYLVAGRDGTGSLKEVWRWCPPAALPIELISFTGKNHGTKNKLQWKTATETNNAKFSLERSVDAVNFEEIGTVKGAGNSNAAHTYNFTDDALPSGVNTFYYRLKQTDISNNVTTIGMIPLNVSGYFGEAYLHFDPPNSELTVFYNFEEGGNFNLEVYDLIGRQLYTEQVAGSEHPKGSHKIYLPSLPDGIYIAKFSDAGGSLITQSKFAK